MNKKTAKFLVIGAGPAGISSARYLNRAGESDVIVLEKSDRVGGKCCTIQIDDRHYEFGAVFATGDYKNVLSLANESHMKTKSWFDACQLSMKKGKRVPSAIPSLFKLNAMSQHVRFKMHFPNQPEFLIPGFKNVSEEMAGSFRDLVQKHGIEHISDQLSMFNTGFGYGYHEEVSAAYYFKYLSVISLPVYEWRDIGYGTLMQRLADPLDIRLNQQITTIKRSRDLVTVKTNTETYEAEHLIVACPLDNLLPILDCTDEERALFERIHYYDYHVYSAEIDGLDHYKRLSFLKDRVASSEAGRPVFVFRRFPGRNLFQFYVLGKASRNGSHVTPDEEIRKNILEDISHMGGVFKQWRDSRSWKYFPHFQPEDFKSGAHDRLESFQGVNRTWFTGEIMNFSCVETVTRYSEHLVFNMILPTMNIKKAV